MYIKVEVHPDAKKEKLEPTSPTHFKISVKEPAKRNLANRRVIELVARHFNVTVHRVRLISGHRSPTKMFSIDETSSEA